MNRILRLCSPIVRVILLLSIAFISHQSLAICKLDPDTGTLTRTFDFGNVVVPPNATIGTVLASVDQGTQGDTSFECSPPGGEVYYWAIAPWNVSSGIDYTYNTNIVGVGVRARARNGGYWYFSAEDGHPASAGYGRIVIGYVIMELVKTGEISTGGTINTGQFGYVRGDGDPAGLHGEDVMITGGTITLPVCNLNNGNQINIDFGNGIAVTDVASGTIEKTVDYSLSCTYDNYGLKMKIIGNGASFNNNLLKTDIAELGITFKADGADYPLNSDFNFATAAAKPVLKAVLTQQAGARLPTGTFSASATMRVEYQ
ncbi:fimbrial protein [Atlantibacter subterranea]|uniref:fimbrial protein n=1 Tax=Atlantibacter subterraneus TaxID=255519 RepID=UPI0020C5212A|nr:fimbrial protein [Atlantibacter subterranea]UTJ49466.1 fimbrial protein [Atlantibacter subterranea]